MATSHHQPDYMRYQNYMIICLPPKVSCIVITYHVSSCRIMSFHISSYTIIYCDLATLIIWVIHAPHFHQAEEWNVSWTRKKNAANFILQKALSTYLLGLPKLVVKLTAHSWGHCQQFQWCVNGRQSTRSNDPCRQNPFEGPKDPTQIQRS